MPELTLRDGMVLVGSLLILAVMIDAWRRMRSQQRERLRVKLAPELPPDVPAEDLTVFRELPNGGARIVSREDLLGSDGLGPSSDKPRILADEELADALEGGSLEGASGKATRAAPEKDPSTAPPQAHSESVSFEGMRADSNEPTNLDWLDDIPEPDVPRELSDDEAQSAVQTEVIILHVMSRNSEGFAGKDILEILLACDLRFGDMNFFHRHEQQAGRGPIQFSVANMLQPGVFDIDNMDGMFTRGLVFFVTLPGPEDMIQAFDYMLETARVVARNLGGDLLDESRSVLTQQAVEHSRQQIRELERRLLAQRG
ncbi:cell division protein ZipA [Congregibacter variabilis]|uniref:Cell division protein ZipA n=1 Tax=Congregibacter variabilis TaxID=3081200 RepID=A0ABZ0I674_9GAMM|nr:cell division protein ZipA [Congregibacter sp. IMCC43200]